MLSIILRSYVFAFDHNLSKFPRTSKWHVCHSMENDWVEVWTWRLWLRKNWVPRISVSFSGNLNELNSRCDSLRESLRHNEQPFQIKAALTNLWLFHCRPHAASNRQRSFHRSMATQRRPCNQISHPHPMKDKTQPRYCYRWPTQTIPSNPMRPSQYRNAPFGINFGH